MAGFTVTATNITDTTAVISVAADIVLPEEDGNIVITVTSSGTQVATQSVTPSGVVGDAVLATFTGLTASTGYTASFNSAAGDGETTFTTKATGYNDPRTATQEQWEDMIGIIKSKADSSDIPTNVPSITMTTTDPGEGSALAANHYIGVYGGDPIITDYSTSEVNTGMKWIDGSAIYKKTINVGAVTAGGSTSKNHGITSLGTFVKAEAWGSFGNVSSGYFWQSIPWVGASNGISLTVTEDVAQISSAIANNLAQSYVTLYYTKSS